MRRPGFCGRFVTPEKINFLARYGRGLICMPITASRARNSHSRRMAAAQPTVHGTNFTVAIEAAEASAPEFAADRAHTIRVAPEHARRRTSSSRVMCFRSWHKRRRVDARRTHRGMLRPGATRRLDPAAVLCEIMNDDGTMHGCRICCIRAQALVEDRHDCRPDSLSPANESLIERVGNRAC